VSAATELDLDPSAGPGSWEPFDLIDIGAPVGTDGQSGPVGSRFSGDRGQATAEYALVLLGVAAIALAVFAWAGGTDKIGDLMDAALDAVISKVV